MNQMQVMCKTITGVEYLPHISESDTRNSVNKKRTQVSRNRLAKSDTAYLGMKVDAGFFSLRQKYQHINYTAYFNFFSKKKKMWHRIELFKFYVAWKHFLYRHI